MIALLVTFVLVCSTTHAAEHLHPIIHTNHPYLNIRENSPIGTEIFVIDATSQFNDTVSIKAYGSSTQRRVTLVPISIGIHSYYKVLTHQLLDRETEWTWYLTFQAHDIHSDTIWTVPLHIDDVNDNAPFFEHPNHHGVLAYGAPVGTEILHMKALDVDEGSNAALTYSMTEVPGTTSLRYKPFGIDPQTGTITVTEELQHGQLYFHYIVNATDNGVPKRSATAKIDITLLDFGFIEMIALLVTFVLVCSTTYAAEHLHPIIHTNHPYLSIRENSPIGTEIFVIDATSQFNDTVSIKAYDSFTQLRVTLVPISIGIHSYYKVLTNQLLDRETELTWYLTFQAQDIHSDTIWTVPLHIDDVNDNAPVFEHSNYHGVLAYGAPVGTVILHVKAIDYDVGPNAALTYSMTEVPGTTSLRYKPFGIDPETGTITVTEELQHGQLYFHYIVHATDNGVPMRSATAKVDITLFDLRLIG